MKLFLICISLVLSMSSFASFILDGHEIVSHTNPVVLEKTASTPFNNYLKFPVVSKIKECIKKDQVWVYEQNAKECGYETEESTVCTAPDNCIIYYNDVARSCSFYKDICKKYNTYNKKNMRNFNLQFSRFLKNAIVTLSISEDEELKIKVEGVNSSCVKKVFYKTENIYTGAKLKIKRRCR